MPLSKPERDMATMKAEYEKFCEVFIVAGLRFFYHAPMCGCENCTSTRLIAKGEPWEKDALNYQCVTLNDFENDRHWYQSLGKTLDTKEKAAARCMGLAGGYLPKRVA